MSKDDKIEVHLKEENGKITSSIKNAEDVTFINDGIDVTNDVEKSMKEEIEEMEVNDEMVTEIHSKNEDNLLGEKLIATKPTPSSMGSNQKMFKKGSIEGTYIPLKDNRNLVPNPKQEMEEIDLDGDGERTTASIKSVTPAKNPFDGDDDDGMSLKKQVDKMGSKVTSTVQESEGRVKRFFKEIKDKSSCKNADTAIEDASNIDIEKLNQADYAIDNKTSKVCTIL